MNPVVVTVGLTKRFGSEAAVDGLDMTIPKGAAVGLLGPNGAGKSTLIQMLLGLLPPTTGNANVLGIAPPNNGASVRARVGYVPERHHIYPWMTVNEVVAFTRSFYPSWNDRRCAELIARYALPGGKKVKQLSHGMGTKLSLVLALSHEPELLILDEPTIGLDPIARDEFVDEVAQLLSGSEQTILFSSHILSDVERIADTIAILDRGRLLAMESKNDLIARTKRVDVTLIQSASKPASPAGSFYERVDGNRWTFTHAEWNDAIAGAVRAMPEVASIDVQDLAIDAIFKDYVRGNAP